MGPEDIDITSDLKDPNNTGDSTLNVPDGAIPASKSERPDKPLDNLRDTLSQAFKGTKPEADDDKPGPRPAKPEEPKQQPDKSTPPPEDKPKQEGLTQDAQGRWRKPDGTFASAEETPQQQQAPPSPYLNRFTQTERDQFQALPEEIQQFVGRTMEAVEAQAGQFAEYNLLEREVIGPRRQQWASEGMTPAVAMQQLFAISDFAARDPAAFVMWYANERGLDLDKVLDEYYSSTGQDNPALQPVLNQMQAIQQSVDALHQDRSVQVHQRNVDDVRLFAEERDEAGQLRRPYLADVMETFIANIQAIRSMNPSASNADILTQAYDNACWTNPQVRDKMQQAELASKQAVEAERVQKAKLASASINGGPSGETPPVVRTNDNASIRDDLKAAFAQHS